METMTDYQKQAADFAKAHGITLTINGSEYKRGHFGPDDWQKRTVFNCTLKRGRNSYTFDFGQSVANGSQEPTIYEVLACMTKDDPGAFIDFCGDFGYDPWDKHSKKIHKAVQKEYKAVVRLFGDIMDELQEIQ